MNHKFYIKFTLLFFLVFSFFFASAQNSFSLQTLQWLEGSWVNADSSFIEEWKVLDENSMSGKVFLTTAKKRETEEQIQLFKIGKALIYRAWPKQNAGFTDFKLTTVSNNTWVFENQKHHFPKKIVYKKVSNNAINITLSAEGKTVELNYYRIIVVDEN